MSRRIGGARLAWRSSTTTPAISTLVVVVVALVAFAGSAAPGLLQAAQANMLRHAVAEVVASQRDFSDSVRGVPFIGPGFTEATDEVPEPYRDSWGSVLDELRAIGELSMTPELSEVVGFPRANVRFDVVPATPDPDAKGTPNTRVILTLDPLVLERVDFVDGGPPAPVVEGEPIEIVMVEKIAEQTGWTVGEVRSIAFPGREPLELRLSGIMRPHDPSDGAWSHVPTSLSADIVDDGLAPPVYTGVAFADAASLPFFEAYGSAAFIDAWFPLEVDRIESAGVRELIVAMRNFGAAPDGIRVATEGDFQYRVRASFGSVAPAELEQAQDRAEGVAAVIAVAASGPLAVAAVVLVLAARLLAVRRRMTVALSTARGASRLRLASSLGIEGLALGALGATLGAAAGLALGHGSGPVVLLIPIAVALIPAVALPVLALSLARRSGRADDPGRSRGLVRRIAEWAVVGFAAAAVVLILVADQDSRGSSPLLVLLPVLLAGAGCVLALHLTPVLLRLVGRTARTARGLVPLLGPARAERDPAVGLAPVLAIVVGTAIAVFSSGFLATVSAGTETAARAAVGGDLRVSAPYLTQDALDGIAATDGIAASAPVYADVRAPVEFPRTDTKVTVFVVDAAELRRVQQNDPAPFPLPAEFDADGGEVPIVASQTVIELASGEDFEVDGTPVRVVASVAGVSPFGSQGVWVAVDRARAAELIDEVFSPEVVLVSLEPDADREAVAAALVEQLGTVAVVTTPDDLVSARATDPGAAALSAGLSAAIAAVAVLLGLAIALTLVLASGARGRLFALLGALGLPRRHELGLVAWELVPIVLVAVPIGALVGMALTPLVAVALDLTVFTGGAVAPAISFGGAATAGLVLLILVVALLAIAAAALIARRTTTARVLRTIDEEG